MTPTVTLDRARFDAVVFDLDGVITSTQRLHAQAWKAVFDEVVDEQSRSHDRAIKAFEIEPDYYRYVDGKPRYDGVRSFLDARGINLPFGNPGDAPSRPTICGIGNLKNELYQTLLRQQGAEVYPAAITLIKALRRAGFGVAVVSSSRNCETVLQTVGTVDLFHVRIDGNVSDQQQLAGKPAPDIFLAAARLLTVPPERAVVVEDAIAGVSAGRAGSFGLVIGVDRRGERGSLLAGGAHVVVDSLADVSVGEGAILPAPALDAVTDILAEAADRPVAVFLDYDGTLTPIVARPEDAMLSDAMRRTLDHLARTRPTAVISGRDVTDVRERVALDNVIYAGSHGLDMLLSDGERHSADDAEAFLPELERAASLLRDRLAPIEGAIVERKRFAIAAHYRLVAPDAVATIEAAVDEALRQSTRLRKRGGKRVFELLPDIDWNKGAAVRWLLGNQPGETPMPIYIGDDLTDEDAFHALRAVGVGIAVMDTPSPTAARYSLPDTDAVRVFLERLAEA